MFKQNAHFFNVWDCIVCDVRLGAITVYFTEICNVSSESSFHAISHSYRLRFDGKKRFDCFHSPTVTGPHAVFWLLKLICSCISCINFRKWFELKSLRFLPSMVNKCKSATITIHCNCFQFPFYLFCHHFQH